MKKWIEKHGDKTRLILLTIIGLTIITLTYVKSLIDEMVIQQDVSSAMSINSSAGIL